MVALHFLFAKALEAFPRIVFGEQELHRFASDAAVETQGSVAERPSYLGTLSWALEQVQGAFLALSASAQDLHQRPLYRRAPLKTIVSRSTKKEKVQCRFNFPELPLALSQQDR